MTEISKNLTLANKTAENNIALIKDKVEKATAAMSAIKTVNNDEEDEKAKYILSRVRPTFEEVQKLRKQITDPLDQIKSELMEDEKKISTAKGSKSDYIRIKQLRDQYANKVAAEARAKAEAIEREKSKKIELTRIKTAIKENVENGTYDLIKGGEVGLMKFGNKLTLDNWDTEVEKLNYKPKMKQTVYNKLLQIDYDKGLVSESEYQQVINDYGDKLSYDHINSVYSEQAEKILNSFKSDDLPKIKSNLEELKSLSDDEAEARIELEKEKLNEKITDVNAKYQAEKDQIAEESRDKIAEKSINAEFDAQVGLQTIQEQKGVRKKLTFTLSEDITPSGVVETMAKIITHVVSNEKFKGIIKRDSNKYPKRDEKGNLELVDGVKWWLNEMAKLGIDANLAGIPNVIQSEDISTIVRS